MLTYKVDKFSKTPCELVLMIEANKITNTDQSEKALILQTCDYKIKIGEKNSLKLSSQHIYSCFYKILNSHSLC